jgi:hypothetical protein
MHSKIYSRSPYFRVQFNVRVRSNKVGGGVVHNPHFSFSEASNFLRVCFLSLPLASRKGGTVHGAEI